MRDPIWDGKNPHLWIVSGSSGKELQECRQAGSVIASHVSLPLLAGSLKTAKSMSRLERWCFWTRRIFGKYMEISMPNDNCIADIFSRFTEFCRKNGGIIAQRMWPFLPDRLLLSCALDREWRGGRDREGHCSRHGVCKACLPSRVANLVFDGCGTQFGTAQIKICKLYRAVLENNYKSPCKRATLLQVTCLFLRLQAFWRPRGPRLVLNAGAFRQEEFGASR